MMGGRGKTLKHSRSIPSTALGKQARSVSDEGVGHAVDVLPSLKNPLPRIETGDVSLLLKDCRGTTLQSLEGGE